MPKVSCLHLMGLGLLSTIGLASAPATAQSYYREEIILQQEGGRTIRNDTPHTGVQTQVFPRLGSGSSGGAVETVSFDSDPAPFVEATTKAWMGQDGLVQRSTVTASLGYEFALTGPANALVPIRILGRYDLYNDSFLTYTNASAIFTTTGGDYSRADQIGFSVQCDGSAGSSRCFTAPTSSPSANSSIQVTMQRTGFDVLLWGGGAEGTFQGLLMAPTDAAGRARGVVNLQVFASALGIRANGEQGVSRSFIDPELAIAPEFLAANPSTQLRLTAGVGSQMVPVPEPASGAMLLVGLAGLVWARRRSTSA